MATINTAKHFRLEDEIGSITPGRLADILIVKNIRKPIPKWSFLKGKLWLNRAAFLKNVKFHNTRID